MDFCTKCGCGEPPTGHLHVHSITQLIIQDFLKSPAIAPIVKGVDHLTINLCEDSGRAKRLLPLTTKCQSA